MKFPRKSLYNESISMNIWYQICLCSLACLALALFLPEHNSLLATQTTTMPTKNKTSWKRTAKDVWIVTKHMARTNWLNPKTLPYLKNSALTPLIGHNSGRIGELFFRSSQPSKRRFKQYIRKHGIKTSINLRDNAHQSRWWRRQQQIAQKHNASNPQNRVTLHNIAMSSRTLPHPTALKKLLDIYYDPNAYPIQVNCHFGRDRTGLASALYVLEIQGKPLAEALKQFDFFAYGHIEKHMPCMKQCIRLWHSIRQKQQYDKSQASRAAALETYAQEYHNIYRREQVAPTC